MDKYIRDLFNDEILDKLIKFYNLELNDVYKVGGFENFIYGYNRDSKDYILRISHSGHRVIELVKSELDFIDYLAKNNANVSTPVKSIRGELVERVETSDGGYFTISCYTKAKGAPPKRDNVNDAVLYNYGKTIGLFHRLTKDYKPSAGILPRFNWDDDPFYTNARAYLKSEDDIIYQRLQEVMDKIRTIPQNRDNYGLIHTDIHFGNVFVDDNNLTVFDFDDCSYFYFISDIAIALFYFMYFAEVNRQEIADKFLNTFMKGYNTENKLAEEDYKAMNLFLKFREITLYIVVLRSCDLATDKWGQKYHQFYRQRIIDDVAFLED